MQIKVRKAEPVAKPEIGDILYAGEYLNRVRLAAQEFLKLIGPHRLVQAERYGFKSLSEIGVNADVLEENTVYNCPWSDNRYHWMYPLGIITNDEKRYGRSRDQLLSRPWLCRKIDIKTNMDNIDPFVFLCGSGGSTGRIVDAMLGHGYTSGTLPCDGHGEKVLATVPLDNGDELLVVCWVWFNK